MFSSRTGCFDDPSITFGYARDFAAGRGAVWNIGERTVRGYISVVWRLSSLGIRCSFSELLFAEAVDALSAVTTLALILSPMADL